MSFETAFQKTVSLEGVFSKEPKDPGNWTGGSVGCGILKGTKYGISAAQFPDLDIENLTIEDARFIYERYYWMVMGLDQVINSEISDEIFDTGVNMGQSRAVIIAQRAVNFLGGFIVDEDGVLGPLTANAINAWSAKDPEALFKALNGFQFTRYVEIVQSSDHTFARGWMKRIQEYKKIP